MEMTYGPRAVVTTLAAMAGGLPPFKLKRRRKRTPNPVVEAAAAAKRARKVARFEEDARRTQAGRDLTIEDGEGDLRLGFWDCVEFWLRYYGAIHGEETARLLEPKWRIRARGLK